MNIFEGARRIAKIGYVLIIAVGALVLFTVEPYMHRQYSLLDGELIFVDTCGSASRFEARVDGRPAWASIYVCGAESGPDTVSLNKSELMALDQEIYNKRFERYGEVISATFFTLLAMVVFVWCAGWVIRGFLGIPKGQDKK